jgi:hypothetical protein
MKKTFWIALVASMCSFYAHSAIELLPANTSKISKECVALTAPQDKSDEPGYVIALDQRCASSCEARYNSCMSSASSKSGRDACKAPFLACVNGCPN